MPDGNGPPLRLPTVRDGMAVSPTCQLPGANCDGFFEGEKTFGRVTGNNVVSWTPQLNDWYETIKLNYGFNFTDPSKSVREYPNAWGPDKEIPDTWKKMDQVIAHWQSLGVDGFRCDMSHMVPPEFWNWAIAQARARQVDVVFIGEAYDNDPAKVPGVDPIISRLHGGRSSVMFDLLNAGFNAVYDDQTYRALKKIYEGPGWANDIDDARPDDFIFENSIRYAENHDEVRLAAKSQWAGVGKQASPAICAILYGLSRGPMMLYNGQEVGEPGEGLEGFGSNDARTSIFDYWSMPELVKWVNGRRYDGGRLSPEQRELRSFYSRLISVIGEPAFRYGVCIPLNGANRDNPNYGRLPNEQPSGHWLYSFLRHDLESSQTFLIVVNLNPWESLKNVRIVLPGSAAQSIGLNRVAPESRIHLTDRLAIDQPISVDTTASEATGAGVPIVDLPALTPIYFEMSI
jgi:glycosidase